MQHPHYSNSQSFSLLPVKVRIYGRRLSRAWASAPRWARWGLYVVVALIWLRYALIVVLA